MARFPMFDRIAGRLRSKSETPDDPRPQSNPDRPTGPGQFPRSPQPPKNPRMPVRRFSGGAWPWARVASARLEDAVGLVGAGRAGACS